MTITAVELAWTDWTREQADDGEIWRCAAADGQVSIRIDWTFSEDLHPYNVTVECTLGGEFEDVEFSFGPMWDLEYVQERARSNATRWACAALADDNDDNGYGFREDSGAERGK